MKLKKMPIIYLWLIFILYIISLLFYAYIVDKRVVLMYGKITNIEIHQFGGGRGGSCFNSWDLEDKKYKLHRSFAYLPSIYVLIEEQKVKEGNIAYYFVDSKQIEKNLQRKTKKYTPIGLTISEPQKKCWYWYSLFSFILKDTFMLFITLLICTFILSNVRNGYLLYLIILYLITWMAVF